jgi:predicted AAA+ superfamily ATPase
MLIPRHLVPRLTEALDSAPAVVLLGPRQAGKTTLALEVGRLRGAHYLDLESSGDRAKLADAEAYLSEHADHLVILDEVHRQPGLFPILRGLIDRGRRSGRRTGRFLLLGSASLDMLRQAGETLAGRVAYLELPPLQLTEATGYPADVLWLRGGFSESLLAASDRASLRWRQDFIRSYLERDIPQFGRRIPAETLRRFWTMLAHLQGSLLNAAQLARSLGVDGKTIAAYLDLLVDLLLVRRLPPWNASVGKRLVRSPKVYVRDSGLVHALLDIADREALLANPVVGASWEGFVIDNVLNALPASVQASFYRSAAGAGIDLLLTWPDRTHWAIEIKRSSVPKIERGFHSACADVLPARKLIVYPGSESWRTGQDVEVLSLERLLAIVGEKT